MKEEISFEQIHRQYEPMIFYIIKKLSIYQNKDEFYQIGCIALWEASRRFDHRKGEFKAYAYSYIIGKMKSVLTKERNLEEKSQLLTKSLHDQLKVSDDDFRKILTDSFLSSVSKNLTLNQKRWLISYCLYGKTPSDIAKDEGIAVSKVKAWRRDALVKLKKLTKQMLD